MFFPERGSVERFSAHRLCRDGQRDGWSGSAAEHARGIILGGVNFGGGRGGMAGPAVAAFMPTFLFNFLTSFGLGEPEKLMLQGAIIVVAALTYSMRQPNR